MGMSVSLVLAIPLALLAIVLLLCFVGCDRVFGLSEIPAPFNKYTDSILAEPTLIAYWQLGEAAGAATASDLKGNRNGMYVSEVFPADPASSSAAAPGTLVLGQPGIVSGDTVPPHDGNSPRTSCIEVNGGFINVAFDAVLNPSKADGFTLEAWVNPGWSADPTIDPPAYRTIMTALDQIGGLRGFWLFVNPDNIWEAFVGNGPGPTIVTGPEALLDTTNHVVLTYDGNFIRLFVNGTQVQTVASDYVPTDQSRLFIGAGAPHLPDPRFPWVGEIQCAAIYKGALSPDQIATHAFHGNGSETP
jgi:hypothetical protein